MVTSKSSVTTAVAMAMALSLSAYTIEGHAAKKGPRASVDSLTTCALNGSNLDVTVTVTNKTSGDAIAVLDAYSITPVYKAHSDKGNTTTPVAGLGASSDTNTLINDGMTISHSFALCDAINNMPIDLRALNAEVSVSYGSDDGLGGVSDVRTIVNSCKDDPATEAVEPSGIKISYDELATLCAQ